MLISKNDLPSILSFSAFRIAHFQTFASNFFESHSFSLYVVNGLLNVGRKRLQMEQLENTLRTHAMTCDNSTVSITLKNRDGSSVEILVFGVYKNPLLLREVHMINRTMLISFLDRWNSENSWKGWQ